MKVTGNLVAGTILVSLGIIFLLGISNFWPFILIVLGLFLLSKRELTISFVLLTIGSMFLISEFTGYNVMGKFWPLILIAIGASLLLKNFKNTSKQDENTHSSDETDMTVLLSEGKQRVVSSNYKGGKVDVLLGDAKLDLREATISKGGAKLSVSVLLGSAKIMVPEGVTVNSTGTPMLGDWKNEYEGKGNESGPTLTIDGTAILGEVRIQQ